VNSPAQVAASLIRQVSIPAASGAAAPTLVTRVRCRFLSCLLTICGVAGGLVVSPLSTGVAAAQPAADFDWGPKPVLAGKSVTFTSTSTPTDADTPITKVDWNLDGDRRFEIRSPAGTITAEAPAPGTWTVGLRVVDSAGESDRSTKTITVQAPPPPTPNPSPSPPPNPPPPPPPNQPPNAAFAALPASPFVGEEVTFVSYSEDRDGKITEQAWDTDGDGSFDDAAGPIATRRFSVPGLKPVTLRVTDDSGAASTLSLTVPVREQPAGSSTHPSPPTSQQPLTGPTPLPSFLSPFPIVRLIGSVTQEGTRIHRLTVRAPTGARALVRCRGRGCPVTRAEKLAGRAPLRFKALERLIPAGVVLEVLVYRGDLIGKYTRFKLRQNRLAQRTDGCLWPSTRRMAPCPRT
jgi:hypothetical protein